MNKTQSAMLELPKLPVSLLTIIGEYGTARTDGMNQLEVQHRWERLIEGIKDYAFSAIHALSQQAELVGYVNSKDIATLKSTGEGGVLLTAHKDEDRDMAIYAAPSSQQTPVPAQQPTPQEEAARREFNAKRLRRVVNLLGLESSVPESDEVMLVCMGSILGMAARKIEEITSPAQAPVQQVPNSSLEKAYRGVCALLEESNRRYLDSCAKQYIALVQQLTVEQKRIDAIKTAYGYLWHVNAGAEAPAELSIPTLSPKEAAYRARRVLRDLLTHEQRGQGINEVRANPDAFRGYQAGIKPSKKV